MKKGPSATHADPIVATGGDGIVMDLVDSESRRMYLHMYSLDGVRRVKIG